jgi:carbamoyl-phosphate synthase large subunit
VLITVADPDKRAIIDTGRDFVKQGFKVLATEGTHKALSEAGITAEPILKMHQGRPNIVDAIKNKQVQLIINTPVGKVSQHEDSYIRKAAIQYKIPYITTASAAAASIKGIAAKRQGKGGIKSLQEYHASI